MATSTDTSGSPHAFSTTRVPWACAVTAGWLLSGSALAAAWATKPAWSSRCSQAVVVSCLSRRCCSGVARMSWISRPKKAHLQRVALGLRQVQPVQQLEHGAKVPEAVFKARPKTRLQVVHIGLAQHQAHRVQRVQALQNTAALVLALCVVGNVVQGKSGIDQRARDTQDFQRLPVVAAQGL